MTVCYKKVKKSTFLFRKLKIISRNQQIVVHEHVNKNFLKLTILMLKAKLSYSEKKSRFTMLGDSESGSIKMNRNINKSEHD